MANQLTVQEQEAIKALTKQGWKIRRIAKELGISRNTVRQYVRAMEPAPTCDDRVQAVLNAGAAGDGTVETAPLSTPGTGQIDPLSTPGKMGRKSLCEDHEGLVRAKVQVGLTAQRIFQDLQTEVGFGGSYQSVKRYVGKLRQADPQLVCRIEVQPAEEVQVDFGAGPMLEGADGKKTKSWIFRMVLSHSRKGYTEAVLRQNTETFLRCLENAFREFGGVSLTINLDNLKAAVLKFDWADPELNPKLREFARHYDTTILPCLPRTPEHKGKVENNIRYVRENALAGRAFTSLAALNQHLFHWEKNVADVRIHGTTKRQVAAVFQAEKPLLKPLPASLFPCFEEGRRTVHRDGHVEVAKAYYHVPPEYLRGEVWVRHDSRQVRLFVEQKDSSLKLIQTHRRLEPGQFTNPRGLGGGYGPVEAQLQYWLKRAQLMGSSCAQWAQELADQRGIGGIRSLMGLVRLVERHSFATVNRACAKASAKGTWRLRDVTALMQSPETQSQFTFEENHPLIRNLSEYGIFVRQQTQTPTS
jgi:transposase